MSTSKRARVSEEGAPAPAAAAVAAAAEDQQASTPQMLQEHFGDLEPNVVVCMRTLQAAQWRTLVDSIKDLMPECPMLFKPDGVRLISMDRARVAMVHAHVVSEFYYCRPLPEGEDARRVGVDLQTLYKLLRGLTAGGFMLEFQLTEDDPDNLRVTITNGEKSTVTRTYLRLLEPHDDELDVPETKFNRVLTMQANDFQRYIRELSAVAEKICIRSSKDVFSMRAFGSTIKIVTEIKPAASGMHWKYLGSSAAEEEEVVEGVFLSKYLERFARPLDNIVELFMKPDYPFLMRYKMASASVRLLVSPVDMSASEGAAMDYDM